MKNDEIRIRVSKIKVSLLLVVAGGLFIYFVWFFLKAVSMPYGFNKIYLMVCLSLPIIVCGIGMLSLLTKLFDNTQGLVINDNGIQINIGPNRGQFISWNEITELKIYNPFRGPTTLLIFVSNPKDFVTKSAGLKRFLLKMNNVSHKTPLSLTTGWLDCNLEELLTLMEERVEKTVHNKKD